MILDILLLCNKPKLGIDANTIVDHIEAIEHYSTHRIWLCSNIGELPKTLDLEQFDVIIVHYSLSILKDYYLSISAKKKLQNYTGLKVIFVQDEYRQIDNMVNQLAFLKVDVLFTCFPQDEMNKIYPNDKLPGTTKYTNLTGYIPERLTQIKNQPLCKDRPIHVGYRGRKLPFWYGELAYEKWNIVESWFKHVDAADLKVDLSYNQNDRIYGEYWIRFLSSCKTTLGVESGASVMDFTGMLEKEIDLHQLKYPNDSFLEVQQKYLVSHEGKYKLNQISPRCFEAIALKTVLVLYEGEYSGILIPGRHYIMLKKDFSNIDKVLTYLRDDAYLQNMANVAFEEIALNSQYSYLSFVQYIDEIIINEFISRSKIKRLNLYEKEQFKWVVNQLTLKGLFFKKAMYIYQRLPLRMRLVVKGIFRPKSVVPSCMLKLILRTLNIYQNKK
jgi:hypothetical protein